MLTLKQLVSLTPPKIKGRIRNPIIKIIKDVDTKMFGKTPFRGIYAKTSLYNEDSSGSTYTLMIRNHGLKNDPGNFQFLPDSRLWVHCSCPCFTYYLEVALKLRGASDIYDSNGNLPVIRNPRMRPYICKHLLATLLFLLMKDKKKKK